MAPLAQQSYGKAIWMGVRFQVSAPSLAKITASLIEDETFLMPDHSLKMLWEWFSTTINSVGPPSKILVGNHFHQTLTSA
jgi:hypothetical protein